MCGVEVTVGDFMVAEVRIGAGDGVRATKAVVSEMEAFLTVFEVCPVGCLVSSLAMGAVFLLVDNPNVVTSFGLGVGAGAGVGLPNGGG